MGAKRLYQLLIAGIVLAGLGLFGGMYLINGQLEKQAGQLEKQRQNLAVLDGQASQLAQAKADIAKYQNLADIAKNIVPQDKDQAQTVGEIVKLGKQNGVSLSSVTFPSSTLGANAKATKLSQLVPVKGISGVYNLTITIQSETKTPIPYTNFIAFLHALEQNRRTAQVSGITITPDATDPSRVTFSLTLQEYIKP